MCLLPEGRRNCMQMLCSREKNLRLLRVCVSSFQGLLIDTLTWTFRRIYYLHLQSYPPKSWCPRIGVHGVIRMRVLCFDWYWQVLARYWATRVSPTSEVRMVTMWYCCQKNVKVEIDNSMFSRSWVMGFWNLTPCNLIDGCRRFGIICCLRFEAWRYNEHVHALFRNLLGMDTCDLIVCVADNVRFVPRIIMLLFESYSLWG